MSSTDSSTTSQETHFKAFSWYADSSANAEEKFIELSKDVGSGICTVLQILEFDELETEEDRPLFNRRQRGELLRLSMAAAHLLADMAEKNIDLRNARPASATHR